MITHYLSPITLQLVDTESTSMHMAAHTTLSFSWPYGIPLPCPTYTMAIPSSVPPTLRPSPPLSHLHYGHPLLCPTYTMAIPSSVPPMLWSTVAISFPGPPTKWSTPFPTHLHTHTHLWIVLKEEAVTS